MRAIIWILNFLLFLAIARTIWREMRRQRLVAQLPPVIEPEVMREPPPPPVYNIQINHQHHEHNSYIIVTDPPTKKPGKK